MAIRNAPPPAITYFGPMAFAGNALQYLMHRSGSKRFDAFHSPYLYQLFTSCCRAAPNDEDFSRIETARKDYLGSRDFIERQEHGAGSLLGPGGQRQRISTIARHALSLPFQCRFLARLAAFADADCIVELGTSLGITASYMAIKAPKCRIVTVEGDPQTAERAGSLFRSLGLTNITLIQSTFGSFLDTTLANLPAPDLVFIDGDHRGQALLSNYLRLQAHGHARTIMVIDDIHWSKDMYKGWRELTDRPEVTQSVDCFHFGLLFFRPDFIGKEHHRVRLPWRSLKSV